MNPITLHSALPSSQCEQVPASIRTRTPESARENPCPGDSKGSGQVSRAGERNPCNTRAPNYRGRKGAPGTRRSGGHGQQPNGVGSHPLSTVEAPHRQRKGPFENPLERLSRLRSVRTVVGGSRLARSCIGSICSCIPFTNVNNSVVHIRTTRLRSYSVHKVNRLSDVRCSQRQVRGVFGTL